MAPPLLDHAESPSGSTDAFEASAGRRNWVSPQVAVALATIGLAAGGGGGTWFSRAGTSELAAKIDGLVADTRATRDAVSELTGDMRSFKTARLDERLRTAEEKQARHDALIEGIQATLRGIEERRK